MAGLACVEKLFLIQNKLTKIENLSSLHTLTMLELGSNRIRVQLAQNYSNCLVINLSFKYKYEFISPSGVSLLIIWCEKPT